jgi:Zn ribbon nucleic-acid-binding protein
MTEIYVLKWAHCPRCNINDRWRLITINGQSKHECKCGYLEDYSVEDRPLPLGEVSEIPHPAGDRGAPYDEPVTRLERIVCAVMLSPNAGSEKYAAAEVVAYAREIIVEMSKIEKEFGA